MRFFKEITSKKSFKDANCFAPSSCSAKNNTTKNTFFVDIADAVSFLLCLILNLLRIFILKARIILLAKDKEKHIKATA